MSNSVGLIRLTNPHRVILNHAHMAPGPNQIQSFKYGFRFQKNYLEAMELLFKRYGSYVLMRSIKGPIFFVFHTEGVGHVLRTNGKNYMKSEQMKHMKPLLGEGLLTAEGEHWREHRKLIAPEFQHKRMAGFYPVISKYLMKSIDGWRTHMTQSKDEVLNIAPSVSKLTYAIAGESFFSALMWKVRPKLFTKRLM